MKFGSLPNYFLRSPFVASFVIYLYIFSLCLSTTTTTTTYHHQFNLKFNSSSTGRRMSSTKKPAATLQKDAPWRASSSKPLPKIHHSPILRVSNTPHSTYALSLMKHPNPIGSGLANEAVVESAGLDCIVPGQITPVRLLGVKVWPIEVDLKFLEPVGRELQLLGKFMDNAVNLMNKSFIDR